MPSLQCNFPRSVSISKYATTPTQFSKKETMVVSIEATTYYDGSLSCSPFWVATQLLIMNPFSLVVM